MSLTVGGIIKETTKNKILLTIIKFIDATFVRFQQWLWRFIEIEEPLSLRELWVRGLQRGEEEAISRTLMKECGCFPKRRA